MKRISRYLQILLVISLTTAIAFGQSLQTINPADSLDVRRQKENANFLLLYNRDATITNQISGQLTTRMNALEATFNDAITSIGGATLTGKTLDKPKISSYTIATLPSPGNPGTVAFVTDGTPANTLYVDTGAEWRSLGFGATGAGIINLSLFSADPTGANNSSAALLAAIQAAAATSAEIRVDAGTYSLLDPIPTGYAGITITGNGQVIFKKRYTANNQVGTILGYTNTGPAKHWRFRNIEFDGSIDTIVAIGNSAGVSMDMSHWTDVTYTDCRFRALYGPGGGQAATDIKFVRCKFYGTREGLMQSGVQDPVGVTTATYTPGLQFLYGCQNITAEDCDFYFLSQGIVTATTAFMQVHQATRNVKVINCRFIADWWLSPFVTAKRTVSAMPNGFTYPVYLDISSDSFAGLFDDYQTICFPVQISSGTGFTNLFANIVNATGTPFAAAQNGDVIETADGKRAEISQVDSANQATVLEWQQISTFEKTEVLPGSSVAWRLRRHFSTTATRLSNTRIQLYSEPYNPHTGETISHAGINPVGREFKTFAKGGYGGTHINGTADVSISHSYYRGAWADQVSFFDCTGVRITDNEIVMGQDEGITLTDSPGSVVANNIFHRAGVSAIFVGSDNVAVTGNTIDGWGCQNHVPQLGAMEIVGKRGTYIGNTFSYSATSGFGGSSDYCFGAFLGDMSGTVIEGNAGTGRTGTVFVDNNIVSMTVRDAAKIDGPGRSMVIYSTGTVVIPTIYGSRETNGTLALAGNNNATDTGYGIIRLNSNDEGPINVGAIGGAWGRYGLWVKAPSGYPAIGIINGTNTGVSWSLYPNTIYGAADASTAGSTQHSSPGLALGRSYWNGTTNLGEYFFLQNVSVTTAAGGYTLWITDQTGGHSLQIAGLGGQVAVGNNALPSAGQLASRGQFNVISIATTTPTVTIERLTSQSVDLLRVQDESQVPFWFINKQFAMTFKQLSGHPDNPAGSQGRVYFTGNKLVVQYNDASVIKYRYIDLTSTAATWVYTTTPP